MTENRLRFAIYRLPLLTKFSKRLQILYRRLQNYRRVNASELPIHREAEKKEPDLFLCASF